MWNVGAFPEKHALCLLLLLLLPGIATAQFRVYNAADISHTDVVLHKEGRQLFAGNRMEISPAIYTIAGQSIYKGYSMMPANLSYTVRNGKLYKKSSFFSGDIPYTFKDGKIYKGFSTFPLDLMYTVKNHAVYHGQGVRPTQCLIYIDGDFTVPELFAVLLALGYL